MRNTTAVLVLLLILGTSEYTAQEAEAPRRSLPEGAVAVPAGESGHVTLGAFARRVAIGRRFAPADGLTPEGAALALLRNGIRLREELDSPVTEGDVVVVLNALGFSLRTETPSRSLEAERLDAFLQVFLGP